MLEKKGITKVGPIANFTAGAPTNVLLHTITTGRTARIVKIYGIHRRAATVQLVIGNCVGGVAAGAFTQRLIEFDLLPNVPNTYEEGEIPNFEFEDTLNIFAQVSAAGAAPNDVDVQITVEEYGA